MGKRCMGIDPGRANFAIVLLDDGRVVHARMVKNTIVTMSRTGADQRRAYRREIRRTIEGLKPHSVLTEQFAVRGFGTQLTEVINIMIGCVLMTCDYSRVQSETIMASTWKAAARKSFDLDEMYEYAKKLTMAPHVVDALCLATYLHNGWKFSRTDGRKLKKNLRECLTWMRKTSPTHLLKPKKKKGRKKR